MVLIRGTTPTFEITFNTVDVNDITVAYLVFKSGTVTVLEKDLTTATVGENSLAWTLSQGESFIVGKGLARHIDVVCDWKLSDGTRGRSKVVPCVIELPGKNEVI